MVRTVLWYLWVVSVLVASGALLTHMPGMYATAARATNEPVRTQDEAPLLPGTCRAWQQVNDDAFGLPASLDETGTISPTYDNEESYETLATADHLYLGMEADNALGARLWRTREGVITPTSQADWEEIAADTSDRPFGSDVLPQHDHIDSVALFQGMLYASVANRGTTVSGTLVYRSPTAPIAWTQVITPGFGDTHNTNFKDMDVFNGQLCGGTQNMQTGAQVWCTADGITWSQHNVSGFGRAANTGIWSTAVFSHALYVGVQGSREGRLFRTTSITGTDTAWVEVYRGAAGSIETQLLGVLDDTLYIAGRSRNGVVILRSTSGDPGSWRQVNLAGMDGSSANTHVLTDGAAVYRDALYVAVSNMETGVQVWRTTGRRQTADNLVDWEQVGAAGMGDTNNIYAQLAVFQGYLYAWTANYASGQQVQRIDCASPYWHAFLPTIRR